jgi:hypothetical protein
MEQLEMFQSEHFYQASFLFAPGGAPIVKLTVTVPVRCEREMLWSAGEAMARRAAQQWADETGHGPDYILLGVALTDKMSVEVARP